MEEQAKRTREVWRDAYNEQLQNFVFFKFNLILSVFRRSMHNVPMEKIRRMLDGYERFVSVQSIMGSHMPESKENTPLDNKSLQ